MRAGRAVDPVIFLDATLPPPVLDPERFYSHKRRRRYRLATALAALTQVISTARMMNRSRNLPWRIERIVLFGSVLRATPVVGDLDLHVAMRLRDGVTWEEAQDWCWLHGEGATRNIFGWSWEYAALRRLKARRSVVQFYSDDPVERGWPHRVVFEAGRSRG